MPTGYRGNDEFQFTPDRLTTTNWGDFENSNNTYQPEHVLNKYVAKPVRILQVRNDGQRFVPYSYRYGEESIMKTMPGVRNEHVPYDNAFGFPQENNIDEYYYISAKKNRL